MNTLNAPAATPTRVDEAYGTHCPHCRTEVPARASVCTGCGAVKTIRGWGNTPTEQFARFFLWLPIIGGSVGVACLATKLFYEQASDFFERFAMNHFSSIFGLHGLVHFLFSYLAGPVGLSFLGMVAAWLIAYGLNKLWKKLFDSNRPVWRRRL